MATDLERLVVQLSADIKKYENSLNRAMGIANKNARSIESRFASMNKRISGGFGGLATGAAKAFALIGGAKGFKSLSDSATSIDNALKVAGLSGAELESVYQQLFASATKNAAPIETLVQLYSRLSLVQKELGVSQQQIVTFSDNIALALRVGGTSAQEASGALLQLSQSLGGGVVRAEEFNSILEGAPTILQAAAAGIKEAGGSVAKLRQLMLSGKLSSKAFFDGFQAGAPILEQKVAGSVLTIDQRLGNLWTALTNAAREFNKSAKAGETFGNEIDRVSQFINHLDFDHLISEIQEVAATFNSGIEKANAFARAAGKATGLNKVGKAIVGALPGDTVKSYLGGSLVIKQDDLITDRINDAFSEQIQHAGEVTAEAVKKSVLGGGEPLITPKGGRLPPAKKVKPVTLDDYPVDPSGTKTKKAKLDDYQREVQQIKERTAALQAETAAQSGVNPLINDYGFAVEFAAAKQELLSDAQKAGVEITPQLTASIDQLAAGYANAVVASEQLAEKQDEIRQRAEDAMATAKDVTRGIIDGFVEGASAADILTDSLKKIGDALLDDVLSSIFKVNGAAGGGGFLGSIFGSLFGGGQLGIAKAGGIGMYANGTNSAPGGLAIVGEEGPELVNLPRGSQVIPNLPSMKALKAGNASPSITYAPVIDARGADSAAVARLEQVMAKERAEFSARVIDTVKNGQRRRIL